jgi:hypothetical protein
MQTGQRPAVGWRAALLLGGVACLVTGLWGGLLRAQVLVPLPVQHANWITFHGPLMVCGFLGTLISLERAVGLGRWWTFAAPLLAGAGGLSLALGSLSAGPRWALTLASGVFALVTLRIFRIQPALANAVMGCGAVCWLVGNALWAWRGAVPPVVLWWLGFLLLTILGERIELTRFQKPHPASRPWLWAALGALGAGLALEQFQARAGGVLTGAAVMALAAWLGRFDLAWRTVRQAGLPRFMAWCLLSGYVWLLAAGGVIAWSWPQSSGVWYDAALHAFFVGFVFSMIFGHAPVIFPSVLGLPVRFWPTAYVPLALLHASLLVRLAADVWGWTHGRGWGAAGNAAAVGLFLLNTVASVLASVATRRRSAKPTSAPAVPG